MKYILSIFLLVLILGCHNNSSPRFDFEDEVLSDVFLQIPDFIHFNAFYPPYPPPPKPIANENGEFKYGDTIEWKKAMLRYEQEIKELNIDTSEVVLAISDTLINDIWPIRYYDSFLKDSSLRDYDSLLLEMMNRKKEPKVLSLLKFKNTGKYKLKYSSEFPKRREIYNTKYDFVYGGLLIFSRVYVDVLGKKAIFYCGYHCGGECGRGHLVLVKKKDTNWEIDGVRLLWIS